MLEPFTFVPKNLSQRMKKSEFSVFLPFFENNIVNKSYINDFYNNYFDEILADSLLEDGRVLNNMLIWFTALRMSPFDVCMIFSKLASRFLLYFA